MDSLGLAGKPNAGKSTFFSAATLAEADVGNYPFTTIDPNRGIAHVRTDCPCLEREQRCDAKRCHDGKRYVPVELFDVAGLVPGAHAGRGLGNQFLDALSTADVACNVVDASGGTNAEGDPVETGSYDPTEDVAFIERELDLWLTGIVQRNWETLERRSRSPDFDFDDALADLLTGFGASDAQVARTLRTLEYPTDPMAWEDSHQQRLAETLRANTLPIVIVANKADIAPDGNVEALEAVADRVIPATAEGELALRRAAEAGLIAYDPGDSEFTITGDLSAAQERGLERVRETMAEWENTGVQAAMNAAVYDLLDRITVYPVENETRWSDGSGTTLPDAELLPRGATPTDLAYTIHSDIGEGYLHAIDGRSGRRIADSSELSDGDVIKIVSTAN
jgi:ribosome-binding ATPase